MLLKHMRREMEGAKADARDVVELRKEAGMLAAALRCQGILRPEATINACGLQLMLMHAALRYC